LNVLYENALSLWVGHVILTSGCAIDCDHLWSNFSARLHSLLRWQCSYSLPHRRKWVLQCNSAAMSELHRSLSDQSERAGVITYIMA